MEPRVDILDFAKLMERELRAHDTEHGGSSWQAGADLDHLMAKADATFIKMLDAYHDGQSSRLIEQAADVANMCMMIAYCVRKQKG